ncbi:twin-arginine translocase TatA/TatE family subunit [Streptomyces sp. NPDC002513]
MFGMSELAVILLVVVVVLGIKKLPELARSAGQARRILKSEAKAPTEQDGVTPDAGPVIRGTVVGRDEPPARS